MELLALCLIAIAALYVLSQFSQVLDNREASIRDTTGHSLALLCAGPETDPGRFDTPDHELILHDGMPHQNPVVSIRYDGHWPFGRRMQYRYYPLTRSSPGAIPNFSNIQTRIQKTRLRNHQILALVAMDAQAQQQAAIRENQQQLARGVSRAHLAYDHKGRKR